MTRTRLSKEPCCNCLLSLRDWYCPRWGRGWRDTGSRLILFINDIPGVTEYRSQVHYSGRNTSILNTYIDKFKLTEYCAKTHLIKCYATKAERKYADKCVKNIIQDIKDLNPILIVTCGKLVYETLTDREVFNMNHIVNKPIKFANSVLFPIFHPSYVKRSNKPEEYEKSFTLISDMFAKVNESYSLFK